MLGYLQVGGMPQDIKIDPAGKVWYVSNMDRGGVHMIDGDAFKEIGFLPTGPGGPRPLPEPRRHRALRQ